jgi:hypothetical protein
MLLLGLSTTSTLDENAPLELLIPKVVLADYKLFINKRSPADITNFSGQSSYNKLSIKEESQDHLNSYR